MLFSFSLAHHPLPFGLSELRVEILFVVSFSMSHDEWPFEAALQSQNVCVSVEIMHFYSNHKIAVGIFVCNWEEYYDC